MPIISAMSIVMRVGLAFIVIFGGHLTQVSPTPSNVRIRKSNVARALPETLTVDATAYVSSEQTSNSGAVVTFQWICLKNETEINATNFDHYTTSIPGQCFIDNALSDRTTGPLFQTSVRNFRYRFLPQSYFLYVIVHVNSDTAKDAIVDVVMVTVVTGKRPVVTISCIANCADHLNPLLPLALAADCSNCDPMENLSYVWTIHPAAHNNTIMDFDWKTNSVSGNKNRQILLKTGAFLDVDKNETYILTVIVIREDGSHGMAIRPLRVSDAAALRLSMRAVNHRIEDEQTSARTWTAIYVCIGVASLSVVVVVGVVISYRKLSTSGRRILPFSSQQQNQQPEVKEMQAAEDAIDPHRATAAVDVTAVESAGPPPMQSRLAAATTSSVMSSTSMTIQSDGESLHTRRSF